MAEKGDRARLEPLAMRMYADGASLTAIEEALGVSRQTLSAWKGRRRRPGEESDEWDRAREQKRSNVQRLRTLFDRELTALEEAQPGRMSAGSLDAITKLGSLVQRWEAAERSSGTGNYDRPKVFLENLQWIAGWLREHEPEGLRVLAAIFDDMTLAYKIACMGGADDGDA